jgi:hypothetical protein
VSSAALPLYISQYLKMNSYIGTSLELNFIIVICEVQLGMAISQICMSFLTRCIRIEYAYRVALVWLLVVKILYSFLFEVASSYAIFGLAVVDGIGIGVIYTAIEIMIPEVVIDDVLSSSGINKELKDMRNSLIYGWAESIRNVSFALGFLIDALLLENSSESTPRIIYITLCGILPAVCVLGMLIIHIVSPKILLHTDDQAKGDRIRVVLVLPDK